MSEIRLRGMTWDHRRAVDPLLATQAMFAKAHPGIAIEWSTRPLHGFEFTPLAELARSFDVIILDHPFCGDIAATQCLLPVDDILPAEKHQAFVGLSLQTYVYAGKTWAVPVDAACQVAVSRPDLMTRLAAPAPSNWSQLLELGGIAARHGQKLAIGLRGVHSLMTFFTLCANAGRPCATSPDESFAEPDAAQAALEQMRALLSFCPKEALDWSSIDLHDVMVGRDDLVFCPAVYCYATYAEADQRRTLRFHDFPGPRGPGGSTIGGTGLGISAHCAHPEAAMAFARYAASAETQRGFAQHHGQPARIEAWRDGEIDARFGGCYSATLRTMEQCWIRPRFAGYLGFQAKAGTLIERHLRGDIAQRELLDQLQREFESCGRPAQ
ncbi:MAG TPA: extracellular solute-binding protein [Verrucomicrobiae bacterium]|nr:extracellular solute-binding protein [Verrucomicrobiae bacterium]